MEIEATLGKIEVLCNINREICSIYYLLSEFPVTLDNQHSPTEMAEFHKSM